MVLAGSFASKDNADALVAKLKKLGFTKAEGVKFESSANTQVVAGYYGFKGGADAAIRTLKKSKIDAILKKRTGTIYKAQPAPLSKPSSPAAKPAAAPSKPS